MSDLIAIAYPSKDAAERARAGLAEGVAAGLINVEDAVVIIRDEDGTVDVQQGSTGVGAMAAGGAIGGGLIGLIFLAPLLGIAAGAVAGGAAWKSLFGDVGVAESLVKELQESLAPGTAALVVLVRDLSPDKVLPHVHEHGRVIQTSLAAPVEAQIDEAIGAART